MNPLTIVLSDKPFTKELKAQHAIAGTEATFPAIDPVHDAFDDMVRSQRYDVCEMAIGAFLQARDAAKPLALLPVVIVGGFQHRNLYASPKSQVTSAADLKGRRIGVRSYSQTTGLWVRGWLEEEFGLASDDATWVVTEGSHAEGYQDPDNVIRTSTPLAEALYSGEIDAAILGRQAAPDLQPLVADFEARDRAWYERHGCVPINHMVTVTTDVLQKQPDVVKETYRLLSEGIRQNGPKGDGGLPPAVRFGLDEVRSAVTLAAQYAHRQGLISAPVGDIDSLFCYDG